VLEVVFLDIGGVIYDDRTYRSAVLHGLRDLGATVTQEEYDAAYEGLRRAQDGSFRDALAERFLGGDVGREAVTRAITPHWSNPPDALYDDVRPCLEGLLVAGYRLGVIANQPTDVRRAMVRDGLTGYFEFLGVSDDLGIEKPDPRIFAHAVEVVGVPSFACAMVGDRLDHDVRPARSAGMCAVWMLRGEAPERPTPEQLAEPDAWVRTLGDLPSALEAIA
jgi:FMN phosphatase YigB (HAD superfamily)